MRYPDGQLASIGDEVSVAGRPGKVVCSIDNGEYSDDYPENVWAYLQKGVMIEIGTMGLVHYEEPEADMILVRRHPLV
ncbi:conserved hypothetical protein [Bradyrhizobium sp. STM 3843]|nr:conserved hypothetical protein [Bradyrhizobium sp. STM 3843]